MQKRRLQHAATGKESSGHDLLNDDESGLHQDYDVWLEKLAPHEPVSQYRHNVGEDNADAHMKRQVMGWEVVVAVAKGKLDFGPGSRYFTASSMEAGKSGLWSRLLGSNKGK